MTAKVAKPMRSGSTAGERDDKKPSMRSYPEYKDSSVYWLGEIPSHWKVVPCRAIVRNLAEKNEDGSNENYLSLMANVGVIPYEEKGDVGNKKPDDLTKCKIVRKGNLVINSMNYAIGSYGMSPYDGVCSPVYIVLGAREDVIEKRFALRVFENKPLQKHLALLGNGILAHRAAIKWDDIKSQYVALPPLDEQASILAFLDRETARIDDLIAEKQNFINLLKGKRQALISHVVTKGLDPKTKMKASGIEWIGEVPEHWRISKIKWLSRTESGGTPNTENYSEFYENGTIPWIRTTDLNNSELLEVPIKITETALRKTACSIVPKGSVLVAMYGGAGSIGKHSLLMFDSSINQAVCAILPCKSLVPEFLHLFIEYCRPFWMLGADGTRKDPNINQDVVKNMSVPIPSLEEQSRIVGYFRNRVYVIEQLISETNKSVELLKEHRMALISAAVTGKIDVREQQ